MLVACRECGEQVSTEAATCPHCGVSPPVQITGTDVGPDIRRPGFLWTAPPGWPLPRDWEPPVGWRPDPTWAAPPPGWRFWQPAEARAPRRNNGPMDRKSWILVGIVAVAVLGFFVGRGQGWFPTGSVDSHQVAASIAARYTQIVGHEVTVTCPSIPRQKGKISDCMATRTDTGASTRVFVKQIDTDGHFSFSPEDVSVLVGVGEAPTPAVPDTSNAPVLSDEDAAKQNDKGWVLEDYTAGGSQSVAARIKNANAETSTAFFTMTLLSGGTVVATWHGSATSVEPGAVVTVTMITADTIPAGVKADDMQFQTDTSIGSG